MSIVELLDLVRPEIFTFHFDSSLLPITGNKCLLRENNLFIFGSSAVVLMSFFLSAKKPATLACMPIWLGHLKKKIFLKNISSVCVCR